MKDRFHQYSYLLSIGEGHICQHPNAIALSVDISIEFLIDSSKNPTITKLFHYNYPDFCLQFSDIQYIMKYAILAPIKKVVDQINSYVSLLLPRDEVVHLSVDSIALKDYHNACLYPVEFLNSLSSNGLLPHRLHLKVGLPIILFLLRKVFAIELV